MERSVRGGIVVSPSLLVFVFCVLIYTSIFYTFNISPSSLFNNSSKFWFFISNTLIFILAADYGSFSSSKRKLPDHHYEQYVHHKTKTWAIVAYPHHQFHHTCSDEREFVEVNAVNSKKMRNYVITDPPRNYNVAAAISSWDADGKLGNEKRPKSDASPVVNDHQWEIIVRDDIDEEDNEYSAMSDEELNKRVEEFITKLKRQID